MIELKRSSPPGWSRGTNGASSPATSGLTADRWMRATQPSVGTVFAGAVAIDLESPLEFGLARLLDGFELWPRQVGESGVGHPPQ